MILPYFMISHEKFPPSMYFNKKIQRRFHFSFLII